jgi:hypothetical protein
VAAGEISLQDIAAAEQGLDEDHLVGSGGIDTSHKLLFGLELKAVEGLTAVADGEFSNLGESIRFALGERLGYQILSFLYAGLECKEIGSFDAPENTEFHIIPQAVYDINPLMAVDLQVDTGTTFQFEDWDIGIQPRFTWHTGKSKIAVSYQADIHTDTQKETGHTVQVNFIWKF